MWCDSSFPGPGLCGLAGRDVVILGVWVSIMIRTPLCDHGIRVSVTGPGDLPCVCGPPTGSRFRFDFRTGTAARGIKL